MEFPENRALFSIREMSEICGISRASLLRLEEDGFLKPYFVNAETGYRYYDLQNVTAVGQYQRMQTIGLSRKEIADLYYERVDSAAFIAELRQKLARLQRFLNEYEMRHDRSKCFSVFYTALPAVTCYCAPIEGSSLEEVAVSSYLAHEKCVKEGYRMLGSEPLMAVYDDRATCLDPLGSNSRRTLCIPVAEDPEGDPKLRHFPYTEAISTLGFGSYGSYELLDGLWGRLFDEVEKRKLEPAGSPRLISLIAPYAGAHYTLNDYCFECAIPIRERKP